jgi:hypothetical protein
VFLSDRTLEEELQRYGLSMESPRKLVSVLLKINQLGYDAIKIVKELARIKSLKHLKNWDGSNFGAPKYAF